MASDSDFRVCIVPAGCTETGGQTVVDIIPYVDEHGGTKG